MNPERWKQIDEVLNEVLDLPPGEREAYLDENCPEPELRREVEELVEAHEQAGDFLESSVGELDDPLIGEEVDGYRIQSILGKGGMGVVYRAEDLGLSRQVALKRVNPGMAQDPSLMRRFRAEAKALARIDSPHIVRVYALRPTDEGVFIVMEYVEGGTLADPLKEGAMEEEEAVRVFRQMLMAFRDAHRAAVIHRDIKPQNIMLADDGRVKVTDFGLARLQQRDKQATVTQTIAGTLNYMSPEQVRDPGGVDHRSDLYSLGMTFYEMLTGQLPFDDDSNDFERMQAIVMADFAEPCTCQPDVSPALNDLVVKALQRNPGDRFQHAEAMLDVLDDYEASGPDSAQAVADHQETAAAASTDKKPDSAVPSRSPLLDSWVGRVGLAVLMFVFLNAGRYFWVQYYDISGERTEEAASSASHSSAFSVVSDPTNANIFLNGRLIGQTPLSNFDLEGDSVDVRIQKVGFAARDTTLHPMPGEPLALELALARNESPSERRPEAEKRAGRASRAAASVNPTATAPARADDDEEPAPVRATLHLGIEPSGTVSVIGGAERTGSGTLRAPAGRQTIRFAHPQFGVKDTTLRLKSGQTRSLTCYFEQKIGVNTNGPWASFWVNGEFLNEGGTSFSRGPGTYRIEARRAGYRVTGGAYRLKVGGQARRTTSFSGDTRTITIAPSFQRREQLIRFNLQPG